MIVWCWLACSKTGAVAEPPAAVRAGPRAILEGTAPSAVDDGVSIGRNEVVAYSQQVRTVVMPPYRTCLSEAGSPVAEDPVLVDVSVMPDGRVRDVVLSRSSGDRTVDDCARQAFLSADLPEPPPRRIDESGSMPLPTFAFPVQ
ncbi:MAG: TonB family protein [Myxococcota bacterium]